MITLDTTLAELYKIGQDNERAPRIALLACAYSSGLDMGPELPRNKRYLSQEGVTIGYTGSECANFPPKKVRDINAKFFSLVPQRDSFGAGDMDTIFFTWDVERGYELHSVTEAAETYKCLPEHQRPRILSCPGPSGLSKLTRDYHIDVLAEKIPIDSTEKLGNVCNFAQWNYYNSKIAVLESGLTTPKSTVFEPEFCTVGPREYCSTCKSYAYPDEVSDACTGPHKPWLEKQLQRFCSLTESYPLPFVLKSQQSGGGGGTWIVVTELDRIKLLQSGVNVSVRKIFASWTKLNQSLRPAVFLFMEYIRNEVHNWGLTFFITRAGEPIFLSMTEQKLTQGKNWYGSTIDYGSQPRLKEGFTSLMNKITIFLHHSQPTSHRYYGPLGVDILETPPTSPNVLPDDSNYLIVDFNIRIPGSLNLGLLKTHFTARATPLRFAMNQLLELSIDRATFVSYFKRELYETRAMVITAWYFDQRVGKSHVALIVAAESKESLESLEESIKEWAKEFRSE